MSEDEEFSHKGHEEHKEMEPSGFVSSVNFVRVFLGEMGDE